MRIDAPIVVLLLVVALIGLREAGALQQYDFNITLPEGSNVAYSSTIGTEFLTQFTPEYINATLAVRIESIHFGVDVPGDSGEGTPAPHNINGSDFGSALVLNATLELPFETRNQLDLHNSPFLKGLYDNASHTWVFYNVTNPNRNVAPWDPSANQATKAGSGKYRYNVSTFLRLFEGTNMTIRIWTADNALAGHGRPLVVSNLTIELDVTPSPFTYFPYFSEKILPTPAPPTPVPQNTREPLTPQPPPPPTDPVQPSYFVNPATQLNAAEICDKKSYITSSIRGVEEIQYVQHEVLPQVSEGHVWTGGSGYARSHWETTFYWPPRKPRATVPDNEYRDVDLIFFGVNNSRYYCAEDARDCDFYNETAMWEANPHYLHPYVNWSRIHSAKDNEIRRHVKKKQFGIMYVKNDTQKWNWELKDPSWWYSFNGTDVGTLCNVLECRGAKGDAHNRHKPDHRANCKVRANLTSFTTHLLSYSQSSSPSMSSSFSLSNSRETDSGTASRSLPPTSSRSRTLSRTAATASGSLGPTVSRNTFSISRATNTASADTFSKSGLTPSSSRSIHRNSETYHFDSSTNTPTISRTIPATSTLGQTPTYHPPPTATLPKTPTRPLFITNTRTRSQSMVPFVFTIFNDSVLGGNLAYGEKGAGASAELNRSLTLGMQLEGNFFDLEAAQLSPMGAQSYFSTRCLTVSILEPVEPAELVTALQSYLASGNGNVTLNVNQSNARDAKMIFAPDANVFQLLVGQDAVLEITLNAIWCFSEKNANDVTFNITIFGLPPRPPPPPPLISNVQVAAAIDATATVVSVFAALMGYPQAIALPVRSAKLLDLGNCELPAESLPFTYSPTRLSIAEVDGVSDGSNELGSIVGALVMNPVLMLILLAGHILAGFVVTKCVKYEVGPDGDDAEAGNNEHESGGPATVPVSSASEEEMAQRAETDSSMGGGAPSEANTNSLSVASSDILPPCEPGKAVLVSIGLRFVMFPSLLAFPLFCLMEPTVNVAIAVLVLDKAKVASHAHGKIDGLRGLGSVVFALCVGTIVGLFVMLKNRAGLQARYYANGRAREPSSLSPANKETETAAANGGSSEDESAIRLIPATTSSPAPQPLEEVSFIDRHIVGLGEWHPFPLPASFLRRFLFFLYEYNDTVPFWSCVELFVSGAMGLSDGIRFSLDSKKQFCKFTPGSVLLVILLVYGAGLVWKRPFRTPLSNVLMICITFLQILGIVMVFAGENTAAERMFYSSLIVVILRSVFCGIIPAAIVCKRWLSVKSEVEYRDTLDGKGKKSPREMKDIDDSRSDRLSLLGAGNDDMERSQQHQNQMEEPLIPGAPASSSTAAKARKEQQRKMQASAELYAMSPDVLGSSAETSRRDSGASATIQPMSKEAQAESILHEVEAANIARGAAHPPSGVPPTSNFTASGLAASSTKAQENEKLVTSDEEDTSSDDDIVGGDIIPLNVAKSTKEDDLLGGSLPAKHKKAKAAKKKPVAGEEEDDDDLLLFGPGSEKTVMNPAAQLKEKDTSAVSEVQSTPPPKASKRAAPKKHMQALLAEDPDDLIL